MNAEQYRALVAKLEAINPSEPVLEAPVEAPVAADATATNSGSSYTGSVGTATNDPAPAADPNQIPTIEAATFSQAYAQAVKQGLKKFKWCGVYAVKARPRPVQPQPAKPQGKVDYLGQQDPLGGDAQNPMSFSPNSGFGA
jgi:hypothetical protein